jgi:thiamine-phosphate pyrophosphorylase
LARLCREILAIAGGMRVIVAGRVDVAIAVGAAGVHLSAREGELTPEQVRALMPAAFVSVSCHRVEEVRRAREGGASAVLFGPVFGKAVDGVEVVPGVGLEKLREACAVGVPVLALGGVTEANAGVCVEVGAWGVAGIRMFFDRVGRANL